MSSKCPVCNLDVSVPGQRRYMGKPCENYLCPRCGDYNIEASLAQFLPAKLGKDNKKIAVLSHWIRTKYESIKNKPPDDQGFRQTIVLNPDLIEDIIKRPPPNPAEQADNIVRWLGENAKGYGEYLSLGIVNDLSIIGSATPSELAWVARHLIDSGVIEGTITNTSVDLRLSFDGWEYYERLKRGAIDNRKAFMAMKYGEEPLDTIVEDVFKSAVKKTGFDLFKLVERPKAGLIDDRLRVEIQTSRFLIADLTHENAGAYWEAGYAEGLGKPVIYTCEKEKFEEQKTHFDTNHHLTVVWDVDNPQVAAEELKATIRATLPGDAKLTDE